MKILNESGVEITEDEADLTLGYFAADKLLVEKHPAQEALDEVFHYEAKTFYFDDGSSYEVKNGNKDSHVKVIDNIQGVFAYVEDGEEKPFKGLDIERVVDQEKREAKDAWDEYEDIYRYKLYTDDEIRKQQEFREKQQKQSDFLENGPDTLAANTSSIEDITLMLSDIVGGADE